MKRHLVSGRDHRGDPRLDAGQTIPPVEERPAEFYGRAIPGRTFERPRVGSAGNGERMFHGA